MSRYIDYDAIDYRNDRLHDKSEEFLDGVIYMAQCIEEAPSIDIVRCKECIHWKADKFFCKMFHVGTPEDGYCYMAKTEQTEYKKWETKPTADLPTENTTCVGVAMALVEDEPRTDCAWK